MKKNKYKSRIVSSVLVIGGVRGVGYFFSLYTAPKICTDKVCFEVEIARTPQQHQQGLMYRTYLAEHKGMLFVFNAPEIYSFWMKNTLIPLDFVWLDEKGNIVDIQTGAPCTTATCTVYTPKQKAQYVLEIRAGSAKRYKFQEGMKIQLKNI